MRRMPVILIGGIPVIGKTLLARALAVRLNFDTVSTDAIRRIIRSVTSAKKFPGVHFFVGERAELYLPKTPVPTVLKHYFAEARDVWKGIQPLIRDFEPAKQYGLIIEGVAILPEIVHRLCQPKKCPVHIKPIFLIAPDKETISRNLKKRGLWAETPELQKIELEYLWALNEKIRVTAERLGFRTVPCAPYQTLVRRVMKLLRR